jgi:hypothetical protein
MRSSGFHFLLGAALLALPATLAGQRGPAPRSTGLTAAQLALACAPTLTATDPAVPLRVTGGQDSFTRRVFGPGDLITINAGTENGIEVGQEFYVRRTQRQTGASRIARATPGVIHTAGWIRIYAVDARMSLATISHACDTIETDDYLEPFVLPAVPALATERTAPQRDNYGKVLPGADRRTSFGRGDFMIVDRGSDHGVTPGAQFVIYRDRKETGDFLFDLGEAVAVDVKPETSTLFVTVSRDAMTAGDYVALRK